VGEAGPALAGVDVLDIASIVMKSKGVEVLVFSTMVNVRCGCLRVAS
jgi:hypothetical protein